MEKRHLERRLEADAGRGHRSSGPASNVGVDITPEELKSDFDAVVLAGGATAWRDLPIPGRELEGIYQAMEYLPWGNRVQERRSDVARRRRRSRRSPPRTRRSSSSAAVTPGPTAWVPHTVRARRASTSSRSCRGRRRTRRVVHAVADLRDDVPGRPRRTKKAASGSSRSTPRSSSVRTVTSSA